MSEAVAACVLCVCMCVCINTGKDQSCMQLIKLESLTIFTPRAVIYLNRNASHLDRYLSISIRLMSQVFDWYCN